MRSAWQGAIAVVLAGVVGACAAETLVLADASGISAESRDPLKASSTADKPQFNPFADATAAAAGGREVITNPTIADIMKPANDLPELAAGQPGAPVTIIKYASLTCPYCAKFQRDIFPVLKREYIDTGKMRLIIRDFPIGFQSGAASIALRCAPPQKQLALYEKFLSQQTAWASQEVRRDAIFKIALQVGMTRADFDACYQNQGMISALNAMKERGRTLGIVGTPNFFVQDRLVKGTLEMSQIRELVDPIVAGRVAGVPATVAR